MSLTCSGQSRKSLINAVNNESFFVVVLLFMLLLIGTQ